MKLNNIYFLLLVYFRRVKVSIGVRKSPLGALFRVPAGFLLLELLIALTALSFFCLIVGWAQSQSTLRQKNGLRYLDAITQINRAFELVNQGKSISFSKGISIAVKKGLSKDYFQAVTIEASFKDLFGKNHTIAIEGAILQKERYGA